MRAEIDLSRLKNYGFLPLLPYFCDPIAGPSAGMNEKLETGN